ncbi:MAG TPA: AAA family ATPase [Candidatus Bathyarchaeia archaeon]|nr:AAA family ATPase [Candidatus Bathyarchaeia archaeon]
MGDPNNVVEMKSIVVVLTGNPASGKSTLAEHLSEELGGLAVLKFDDYFDSLQGWPNDMRTWVNEGAEIDEWKNFRLTRDIVSLINGTSILNPTTKKNINPSPIILVEDPSGRERSEMVELIDYLIFIEIPNEISLIRSLTRWLNSEKVKKDGKRVKKRDEDPEELLKNMMEFVGLYLESYRDMYVIVCDKVKKKADLIIDGLKEPKVLVQEVLQFLKEQNIESLEGEK